MKGQWHFILFWVIFALWTKEHTFWLGILLLICFLIWKWLHRSISWIFTLTIIALYLWFSLLPLESKLLQNEELLLSEQTISGTIVSQPKNEDTYIQFVLKEKQTKEKVLVTVETQEPTKDTFLFGAKCTFQGVLSLPGQARNPGNFDYREYLKSMGIYVQMKTSKLESSCSGKSIVTPIFDMREYIIQKIRENFNASTAQWVLALIFGERDDLSDTITEEFQYWNLSHLIAISGLHIGLIAACFYLFFVRVLGFTKETSSWILMIVLPIYSILAGSGYPVLRAVAMAEIIFVMNIFNKKWPITDVISISAIIFILLDPYSVTQLSFQFSYIVTFAIILSKRILILLHSFWWGSIYISFISQLVLIPLQILHFYYISPLSLFSNMLFVPYFSFLLIPVCLIAALFYWGPFPITVSINWLMDIHDKILHISLQWLNSLKLIWVIGEMSFLSIIIFVICFTLCMKNMETLMKTKAFIFACMMVAVIIFEQIKPYLNPVGSVTMLDVGQGDTIIVELPYRKGIVMLDVAAENSFMEEADASEKVKYNIKPFLWSKGITKIDHLIITHMDLDHAGGLPYLMKHFKIDRLYVHPFANIDEIALSNQTKLFKLFQGMCLQINNVPFYVLHPNLEKKMEKENDRSIVLYSQFGNRGFLFTGDISDKVEKQIIQTYPNLQVDVLKVAHHGSKYSSSEAFLDTFQPKVGLISVGLRNFYGHPALETIQRLEERNIHIFRTDENGAIIFRFTKDNGTFYPWIP
jgi:competence protein ComEC